MDRTRAIEARDPVPEHAARIHDRVDEPVQHELERVRDLRDEPDGVDERLRDQPHRRPQEQCRERAREDDPDGDDAHHEIDARGEGDHSY